MKDLTLGVISEAGFGIQLKDLFVPEISTKNDSNTRFHHVKTTQTKKRKT